MSFISEVFRWQKGRQKSGYDKMLLMRVTWPVKFDTYLLKFPQGSEIAPHKDKVDFGKHFRLNVVLKKAALGGAFICDDPIFDSGRIKLFRPDISQHKVTKVEKGSRYVLSVGWVRDNSRRLKSS